MPSDLNPNQMYVQSRLSQPEGETRSTVLVLRIDAWACLKT